MIQEKNYTINQKTYLLTNFTALSRPDLLEILHWRNNDQVRFNMNHSDIISETDHFAFVERLPQKKDKCYFQVSDKEKNKIGIIYFDKIGDNIAWLGIYSNPKSPIEKKGSLLMKTLLLTAYNDLSIRTLFLEVKTSNVGAIGLYHKFNFLITEQNNEYIIMKKDLTPDVFVDVSK